tara:strand:+ start:643 stop:834 length:192 start_codon:yes stop_codon:yes gene_type:complete
MNSKDWEEIQKNKELIQEARSALCVDLISKTIKKGWENLENSEKLSLFYAVSELQSLKYKFVS